MPRIFPLTRDLINQIAAGEIIERPASVVKEMVENALDADATDIEVDIENAGSKLIRVKDNGCGIHPDDLLLAFTTHATSKIRTFADLERVSTLGFRGEALPSVASVSKTVLTSKMTGQEHAYRIAPYLSDEITPAPHPQGTTVEIRDLFYNTPARKKFLKSERTERFHIFRLIQRFALSHEKLHITLRNQGKIIAEYAGKTMQEKIASVMGEDMPEQSVCIDARITDMHLWGWVGLPTYSHTQPDKQHFFINRRMIRDKIIVHAVQQAYQDMLYNGRYPVFVLYLDINPELIDVNAHPQKHEVRFRESNMTHDFIYSTLNHALRGHRPAFAPAAATTNIATAIPAPPPARNDNLPHTPAACMHTRHLSSVSSARIPADTARPTHAKSLNENQAYYQWQTAKPLPTMQPGEALIAVEPPLGYAVGQIHGAFILAQNSKGMVIVDMHAAHERILYERLKALLRAQAPEVQRLLIPQSIEAAPMYPEIIEQHQQQLHRLGIELSVSDDNRRIVIHTIPALLKSVAPADIVGKLLQELAEYPTGTAVSRTEDEILSSLSCHKAIRFNDKLSLEEMNRLLRDIETTPAGGQCNHGRPTWTQLSLSELDALFMRGQ